MDIDQARTILKHTRNMLDDLEAYIDNPTRETLCRVRTSLMKARMVIAAIYCIDKAADVACVIEKLHLENPVPSRYVDEEGNETEEQ